MVKANTSETFIHGPCTSGALAFHPYPVHKASLFSWPAEPHLIDDLRMLRKKGSVLRLPLLLLALLTKLGPVGSDSGHRGSAGLRGFGGLGFGVRGLGGFRGFRGGLEGV